MLRINKWICHFWDHEYGVFSSLYFRNILSPLWVQVLNPKHESLIKSLLLDNDFSFQQKKHSFSNPFQLRDLHSLWNLKESAHLSNWSTEIKGFVNEKAVGGIKINSEVITRILGGRRSCWKKLVWIDAVIVRWKGFLFIIIAVAGQ